MCGPCSARVCVCVCVHIKVTPKKQFEVSTPKSGQKTFRFNRLDSLKCLPLSKVQFFKRIGSKTYMLGNSTFASRQYPPYAICALSHARVDILVELRSCRTLLTGAKQTDEMAYLGRAASHVEVKQEDVGSLLDESMSYNYA